MDPKQIWELDLFLPGHLAADCLREHGHEMTPHGAMEMTLQATDDPAAAEAAYSRAAEIAMNRAQQAAE